MKGHRGQLLWLFISIACSTPLHASLLMFITDCACTCSLNVVANFNNVFVLMHAVYRPMAIWDYPYGYMRLLLLSTSAWTVSCTAESLHELIRLLLTWYSTSAGTIYLHWMLLVFVKQCMNQLDSLSWHPNWRSDVEKVSEWDISMQSSTACSVKRQGQLIRPYS